MKLEKNISKEEFEQIESFLAGSLSGPELDRFKSRIESDEDFKTEVERQRLMQLAIEESALKTDLNAIHNQEIIGTNDVELSKDVKFKIKRYWVFVVMAVLLAILALIIFMPKEEEKHENLYASFFEPDPGLPTRMSITDNYDFDIGMVSYKQGKYGEALKDWEPLLETNLENDTLNYFYAVALLADGQYELATNHLEQNLEIQNNSFQDENHYYLGLAYLKRDMLIKAKEQFSLSQNANSSTILKSLSE